MKAVIVYYSFSGNTLRVSEILKNYLQDKSYQVDVARLEPQDESNSFFIQANRALFKKRAQLKPIDFNLSDYDLICLGTPVWAFGPAPAVNSFLDKCWGISGKNCVVFTTYGSGSGNNRCLEYMARVLSSKGAQEIKRFSIQQFKVKDKGFVRGKIKEIV